MNSEVSLCMSGLVYQCNIGGNCSHDCHSFLSEVSWNFATLNSCLEGQGDLVSRLIRGIAGVTIWVIGVITLLTKSP